MLASPLLERGCVRRRGLRELALQRAICMAGLPLSAAIGGGCRRLFVELLAVADTPLGDVVRPVGVGSRPPDALSASPPKWRGRVTPSSFVAATLPSWGAAATARLARNVHLPVLKPLYWRGEYALRRATCVCMSCARTRTEVEEKVFSRRKSRVFGVDLTAPEVRND